MENLIGHDQQRKALRRQFEHGQLPHALLFSGPSGIGKSLVARELAISILSTETQRSQIEKITDAGNHPDFFLIDCQDTEKASTEGVRSLLHSLHLKSYAGPNRVVILNNVHYLNAQALNALLKSLEEPRPGTYFILVTSHPNNLLKTILSRCQIWAFHSLSEKELHAVLEQKKDDFPAEHMAVLSLIADGSLENVFRLSDHIEEWQQMRRSLLQISLGDRALAVDLAKKLGKEKERAIRSVHFMRILARQKLGELESPGQATKWARLLEHALLAQNGIERRHLNATYLFQAIFLELTAPENVPASSQCPIEEALRL